MSIKLNSHYIATNKDGKEQLVYIDHVHIGEGDQKLYGGYYGYMTYHETYLTADQLRVLTDEQILLLKDPFKLPQEFYQSTPVMS